VAATIDAVDATEGAPSCSHASALISESRARATRLQLWIEDAGQRGTRVTSFGGEFFEFLLKVPADHGGVVRQGLLLRQARLFRIRLPVPVPRQSFRDDLKEELADLDPKVDEAFDFSGGW
jgi:hypothetical protein